MNGDPPPVSATLFPQRDVDIRYDRDSKQHLMVQGDVGSTTISWSLSSDGGRNWLPYDPNHGIATHDVSYRGGANHNPGAVLYGLNASCFMTLILCSLSPFV